MKMKNLKNVMLGLFIAVGTIGMNAQDLHFGAKVGSNFSVQSEVGDLYNNNKIRAGLNAGVFAKYQLNEKVFLQTELNFEQKGSNDENVKTNYDYLTIPLLVGYSMGESWNTPLSFNIYGGPYAGILLNAESVVEIDGVDETTDLNEQTNNAEVGFMGGFVVSYPINDKNLFLDFRAGLGLSPYEVDNSELKNKYIGLSLGLEF